MIKKWFYEGVVYQIYPLSFNDSNNDGIGDIKGIIAKLPYIKDLGATIIWLSPIYASPLDDNGYDISDYYAINPCFGTMDDFDELLKQAHNYGLKIIMDLVVNHTSSEHAWFIEALKDPHSKYHDYYYFRDAKKGHYPNNWRSLFGGRAWSYDDNLKQYYLHLFGAKQPDLNWENPHVREEVKNILRFWLDKGVDGFRCDVINLISKTPGLPNGRFNPVLAGHEHFVNGPKLHLYLQELKREVFDYYDCFTVGESVFITPEKALEFTAFDVNELNMVFQFDHMNADCFLVKWFVRKFKLTKLKKALSTWQKSLNGKAWNTLYFENHDQPRSVSRFGSEEYRTKSAKMLATYLFFHQGTPYIYQGQEIGMTNPNFKQLSDYKDIETHNIYNLGRKKLHISEKSMMKRVMHASRDNARTPMQWDDSEYAGFSKCSPWIGVNPNYTQVNVKNDLSSDESIYKYYQEILYLRKTSDLIKWGDFKEFYRKNKKIACYERFLDNERLLVVANFSNEIVAFKPPYDLTNFKVVLSNYDERGQDLQPYETRVYL